MSIATAFSARPLEPLEAYEALENWTQEHGRKQLLLLMHSAVPNSLRPDLLNIIKLNFVPEASGDLAVDADVLFSPFTEALGAGFYRLHPEIRRQTLDLLDGAFKHEPIRRSMRVARLVLAYGDRLEHGAERSDPLVRRFTEIERWVALAFTEPTEAARRFAEALKRSTESPEVVARLRFGGLAAAISVPLAGHQELLAYAEAVDQIAEGDLARAQRLLAPLGSVEPRLAGVQLLAANELVQLLETKNGRAPNDQRTSRTEEDEAADQTSGVHRERHPFPPQTKRSASGRCYLGPPFEHDIYVSYAHGRADRQGVKRLKHWSERLKEELEGEIVDLLPEFEALNIFIDTQLDPTQPLTDLPRWHVSHSGLLLIIMSQYYLNSTWLRKEREWFEAEVKRRGISGGVVLVVRAQPTNHDDWPTCLKDERGNVVLGFQFHPHPTGKDDFVQPYGWPEPLPQDRMYYEELGKLASIVTQRLRQLKRAQELEDKARRPEVRIEGQPIIYLQAPIATAAAWAEAKALLESAGYRVLPEALPRVGPDLEAIQAARRERLKILREKAHALCLLRAPQSNGIDLEIEAIANDRIALQAFDKDLPCVIIDRGAGDIPRARWLGIDIIKASDDNWLLLLHAWLQHALDRSG